MRPICPQGYSRALVLGAHILSDDPADTTRSALRYYLGPFTVAYVLVRPSGAHRDP